MQLMITGQYDFGWGTVAHYQEDSLASGPEDEKEIDQAESHAEKDAKEDAEKEANKRFREVEAGITREDASSTGILPGTISQGQVVTSETNGGLPHP